MIRENPINSHIIDQLQESLWGSGLTQVSCLEFALLMLAWAKLSAIETIPADLRLTSDLLDDFKQIEPTLIRLSTFGDGGFRVFADAQRLLSGNYGRLLPAFQIILGLIKAGLASILDGAVLIDSVPRRSEGDWCLPSEVADVLIGIAALRPGDSLYLPWDSMGQIAARSMNNDIEAYVETPLQSAIPGAIALLSARPFEVHYADPVVSPSAVTEGKPKKFDVAIAFPPINMRYEAEVAARDWFDRFPERTSSGNVLAIRQLLWQAKRRVVAAVPNGVLFSTGVEAELRRDLVNRGMLEAVIAMRSGLLSYTTMPFSVLILDPRGGHEQIRFINADSEQFSESVSKARFRLVKLRKLIELVTQQTQGRHARNIPVRDLGPDAQLQVHRYVIPETTKKLLDMISDIETVNLRDLVQTIRPMPSKANADESSIAVLEIGAADLPPYGFISRPRRTIHITRDLSAKNENQFLRPFDVVLIVKGSVGKLGIVPPDVPAPGPGGWVAGQSAIVLRSKDEAVVDARTLAVQLRSELGQSLLESIVSGATIPLIQLRELMELPIGIPSSEEQRRAAEALDQEAKLQDEIERLREVQSKIAGDLWSLKPRPSKPTAEEAAKQHHPSAQKKTTMYTEPKGRKFREE